MGKSPEERSGEPEPIYAVGPIGIAGQPALEEYYRTRERTFEALAGHIPSEIVTAVRAGLHRAAIEYDDEDPEEGVTSLRIVPPPKLPSSDIAARAASLASKLTGDPKPPATVAELLAALLRDKLEELSRAQTSPGNAPVRRDGLLSHAVIAEVALDLLEDCENFDYPPGGNLIELLRELLKQNKPNLEAGRSGAAWHKAAQIDAQSTVSARELAKLVGVSHTSIQKWRREPAYQAERDNFRVFLAQMKHFGLLPPAPAKPADEPKATEAGG